MPFAQLSNNANVRAEGYSQSVPYAPADKLVQSIQETTDVTIELVIAGAPGARTFQPALITNTDITLQVAKRPLTMRGFSLELLASVLREGAASDFWECFGWVLHIVRFGDQDSVIFYSPHTYPPAIPLPANASWFASASDDMTGVLGAGLVAGSSVSAKPISYNRPISAILNEGDALVLSLFPFPFRPILVPPTDNPVISCINHFYITN